MIPRTPLVGVLAMLLTILSFTGAAAVGAAVSEQQEHATPELTLACGMDVCVAEATYVLPIRRDGHELTFSWRTEAAARYPDNRGDVVLRTRPAGDGTAVDLGYRYTVVDFIWHSDIRCDDVVTVVVAVADVPPALQTTGKEIPAEPDDAHCSAYGLEGSVA